MRAISNMVVKRDREKWHLALACQRAQEAVIELCEIGCHSK